MGNSLSLKEKLIIASKNNTKDNLILAKDEDYIVRLAVASHRNAEVLSTMTNDSSIEVLKMVMAHDITKLYVPLLKKESVLLDYFFLCNFKRYNGDKETNKELKEYILNQNEYRFTQSPNLKVCAVYMDYYNNHNYRKQLFKNSTPETLMLLLDYNFDEQDIHYIALIGDENVHKKFKRLYPDLKSKQRKMFDWIVKNK